MKFLTSTLLIFLLLSCNSLSGHVEQHVDNEIELSRQEMTGEVHKVREEFLSLYSRTAKNNADNILRSNLEKFRAAISDTDNYLDSLKQDMDKLDEKNVKNVQQVKSSFLDSGAGDTIYYRFKTSILAAQQVAVTEEQKSKIKAAGDNIFGNVSADIWTKETFGLTNPLGASMIIYGLQTELFRIGMTALKDK